MAVDAGDDCSASALWSGCRRLLFREALVAANRG